MKKLWAIAMLLMVISGCSVNRQVQRSDMKPPIQKRDHLAPSHTFDAFVELYPNNMQLLGIQYEPFSDHLIVRTTGVDNTEMVTIIFDEDYTILSESAQGKTDAIDDQCVMYCMHEEHLRGLVSVKEIVASLSQADQSQINTIRLYKRDDVIVYEVKLVERDTLILFDAMTGERIKNLS